MGICPFLHFVAIAARIKLDFILPRKISTFSQPTYAKGIEI